MTKIEYVNAGLNKWDRFRLNSGFIPAGFLAVAICYGLFVRGGELSRPEQILVAQVFVPLMIIAIILSVTATKKKNRLIAEWEEENEDY